MRPLRPSLRGNLTTTLPRCWFGKQINTGILNGYRLIQKVLPQKLKETSSPQKFADYLFTYVQIMRVKVAGGY